jgi:hypothetical protein
MPMLLFLIILLLKLFLNFYSDILNYILIFISEVYSNSNLIYLYPNSFNLSFINFGIFSPIYLDALPNLPDNDDSSEEVFVEEVVLLEETPEDDGPESQAVIPEEEELPDLSDGTGSRSPGSVSFESYSDRDNVAESSSDESDDEYNSENLNLLAKNIDNRFENIKDDLETVKSHLSTDEQNRIELEINKCDELKEKLDDALKYESKSIICDKLAEYIEKTKELKEMYSEIQRRDTR